MGGGGGGEKTQKKFMQGKMPRKKFMQKEGPIVTSSESLSFFQKVWVSEINNITRHNMNKQKSLSSYWKETIIEPCFCFKLQLVYCKYETQENCKW